MAWTLEARRWLLNSAWLLCLLNPGLVLGAGAAPFVPAAPAVPPVFTTQPAGTQLMLGERHRFEPAVTGGPGLAYQWYRDGVPLPAGTNAVLEIGAFAPGDAGTYTLQVASEQGNVTSAPAVLAQASTFNNPIITTKVNTADPWIAFQDGTYYLIGELFARPNSIFLRRSRSLVGLRNAEPVYIAVPIQTGRAGCYAPELHYLQGTWYLYFQSPSATAAWTDRLFVASASKPEGPYAFKGQLAAPGADFFAIDASVLEENQQLYLLWSGLRVAGDLPTAIKNRESTHIYIAPMSNPWTISGPRVEISSATYPWEGSINEAPEVIRRNGKLHIVFSGNGFDANYNLGLLTLTGSDPLDRTAWKKAPGPLFRRYNDRIGQVVGTGHCAFTTSPDGTEDWIVFHCLFPPGTNPNMFGNREIHFQKFFWNSNDEPFFGHPVPTAVALPGPSGEAAPLNLPNTGLGQGLRAEYFAGQNLEGPSKLERVDPAVDFDWWTGAPSFPAAQADHFSARWTGYVLPRYTENYTFSTTSDEGVRLWVNEQPLIDDWLEHTAATREGQIQMEAGRLYPIRLDYFEAAGEASVRLYWSSMTQVREVIPTSQLYAEQPITSTNPPAITRQPVSAAVLGGDSLTLAVAAAGASPLSYQWLFNGQPIPGATNDILSIPAVNTDQAGAYAVQVTNPLGSIMSAPAVLSVTDLQFYAGLKVYGPIGARYRIESRDALDPTSTWHFVAEVMLAASPYFWVDEDSPGRSRRFYRATLLAP